MDKLIIAVCVLGIVVTLIFWVLDAWDHPGRALTEEKYAKQKLMKEIRRHGELENDGLDEGRR